MASLFNVPGSNKTVTWEAEPTTRGTFTLLSTCMVTLFLCVWSSVHLNLPGNDQRYLPKFLRRLSWIAGALFAPEFLILTAWNQLQAAKKVSKQVEKTFTASGKAKVDPEGQSLMRQHQWTMTHSFWVIMGGIAVESNGPNSFIPNSQRVTLTRKGVSLLLNLEPQLLPDISVEEVKDKSKGSSLTKTLACIQATWFCMSCVTRISEHLPLSLLELNTFAHALCTVIVYLIWWRKPLDIEQPVVIRETQIRQLLAYMWMSSKTSCIPKPHTLGDEVIKVGRDPEFEAIIDDVAAGAETATGEGESPVPTSTRSNQAGVVAENPFKSSSDRRDGIKAIVTESQDLPGTGFRVNGKSTRWRVTIEEGDRGAIDRFGPTRIDENNKNVHYLPFVFNLSPLDVRRWHYAREAMDQYLLVKPNSNLNLVTIKPIPECEGFEDEDEDESTWSLFGFTLVAASYGGLHALAWNAHFPSQQELILWRVSALVIASPVALYVLATLAEYTLIVVNKFFWSLYRIFFPKLVYKRGTFENKETTGGVRNTYRTSSRFAKVTTPGLQLLNDLARDFLLPVFIVPYLLARAYLVYESFRTVFFLPPEAYEATKWTQYLPHIT